MPTGTGLARFQAEFPERIFDVGIAEQHAMTLATGLALGGQRPFVALYSTFLQRAFDQVVHDVCQNDAAGRHRRRPRRARRRGRHQPPGHVHAAGPAPAAEPRDRLAARRAGAATLLRTAFAQDHPFALHYPRDAGFGLAPVEPSPIPVGRGEVLREGSDVLFVGFGPIVERGRSRWPTRLAGDGWSVGVIDARFAQPLDGQLILDQARGKRLVVTLEESACSGGFGSGVLELLAGRPASTTRALPRRRRPHRASRGRSRSWTTARWRTCAAPFGSTSPGLADQVRETLAALQATPGSSEAVTPAS